MVILSCGNEMQISKDELQSDSRFQSQQNEQSHEQGVDYRTRAMSIKIQSHSFLSASHS